MTNKRSYLRPWAALCLLIAIAAMAIGCRSARVDEVAGTSPTPTAAPPPRVAEPAPIEAGVAPQPGPYAPGFDALHYDILVQLPDTGSFIRAVAIATVRLEAPRSDTLVLDLSGLVVESVSSDGFPLPYRYADGRLNIHVPASLLASDTLRAEIAYNGHPDDGLILGRNIHGEPTAFADNWPNRARYWFPSIDHPSDKATVRFTVAAGAVREVIANGRLVADGDPAWIWETDVPIPTYTMVIGAADFVVDEIGIVCAEDTCTEVTTWLFVPDTAAAAPSFRRAADMVAYYNRLIAPFPYEKLAHVQSSTRFGGMENVSAIFYPEEALSNGADIELTVAHETVHQWFGDAVTESDWHHLWLSEGFATYFAALYFEEADGPDRFADIMAHYARSYLGSDAVSLPIVNPEQDDLFALLNANNYQKGAWVLHMLRRLLGDASFFQAIRAYYSAHEHGTALTPDLRRALEAASGRDLSTFFDQWVFSPGYPQLVVEWSWDADAESAMMQIEQVQPTTWPAFQMPLEVVFTTVSGTERHQIEIDGRTSTARLNVSGEPIGLEIDPSNDLLKELVSVEQVGR